MRHALSLVAALGFAGCTVALDPTAFLAGDAGTSDIDSGAADCLCRRGDDVCTTDEYGEPFCQRRGADCGSCPSGYACGDASTCRCADLMDCGVECSSDEDCGSGECDVDAGVCRPPLGCLNYLGCFELLCIERRCVITGDASDGAPCSVPADCFSGLCHAGFCISQCLYNDDCASGEVCAFPEGSSTSYCMPPSAACTDCTDEFASCSSEGECLDGCEEELDCFDGLECVLSSTGRACRASPLRCGEGEVVIESVNACAQPTGCYTADEAGCQAGFECRSEESLGLGVATQTGFCVRSG